MKPMNKIKISKDEFFGIKAVARRLAIKSRPKRGRNRCDHEDASTPAETVTDKTGTEYTRMLDGSLRRVSPRPYRGKSERRRVIKERRLR